MRRQVYCMMASSIVITDKICNYLFQQSCKMLRAGESQRSIKMPEMEGVLTTKGENRTLGSISGTEFVAEVDTELGRGRVAFLVRDADVAAENLVWEQGIPDEAFLGATSRTPLNSHMYN